MNYKMRYSYFLKWEEKTYLKNLPKNKSDIKI